MSSKSGLPPNNTDKLPTVIIRRQNYTRFLQLFIARVIFVTLLFKGIALPLISNFNKWG
jgi:hypothetical protein